MWRRHVNKGGHAYFRNEDGEVRWDDPGEGTVEVRSEMGGGNKGGGGNEEGEGSGRDGR